MSVVEERPASADEYLTPQQVADRYNIPLKGLEARRHRRQAPPFCYVGRKIYYRRADIVAWIEKGRVSCES
jgi:hypothetical protein